MSALAAPQLYFHTFWSRPQLADPDPGGNGWFELPEFEALTWLVSALEARQHGRMRLITDGRGLEFIRNIDLEWVYNGGISTELDAIPDTIDPLIFWSAGKLFAWRAMAEPAVSVDPDAICWQPVSAEATVIVLHTEELESGDYFYQRRRYQGFGFDGPEWNWELPPINAGVLAVLEPDFARAYAEESIRFMIEFTAALRAGKVPSNGDGAGWGDAMLFAEQRLITMMLHRAGKTGAALAKFDSRLRHMARNPRCLHLWSTKRFYMACREARAAYANHLIAHTRTTFPEALPTLQRWRLDQPIDVGSFPPDADPAFPLKHVREGHSRLGRINGTLWVEDANLPARRRATPGGIVGQAEVLQAELGATYELIEVRFQG